MNRKIPFVLSIYVIVLESKRQILCYELEKEEKKNIFHERRVSNSFLTNDSCNFPLSA